MALLLAAVLSMQDGLDEWIKRLGHEDPAEREKAEKKIAEKIAEVTKLAAAIEKARASDDAEVRTRAERLRKSLERALRGDAGKTREQLDEEIRKNPDDPALYVQRGVLNLEENNILMAGDDAARAVKLKGGAPAWVLTGRVRAEKRQFEQALGAFDEALRRDPSHAPAFLWRGSTNLACGRLDRAIADLDEAIRLDPRGPDAYVNRSAARKSKGDSEGGKADLRRALEVAPADWPHRKRVEEELKK